MTDTLTAPNAIDLRFGRTGTVVIVYCGVDEDAYEHILGICKLPPNHPGVSIIELEFIGECIGESRYQFLRRLINEVESSIRGYVGFRFCACRKKDLPSGHMTIEQYRKKKGK